MVSDSAATWTVQPLGFSRPECWVGCHALLQGIFPTQGSISGLLPCRWVLYQLNHQCRRPGLLLAGGRIALSGKAVLVAVSEIMVPLA